MLNPLERLAAERRQEPPLVWILRFLTTLLTEHAEAYRLFPLDQNPCETMSSE